MPRYRLLWLEIAEQQYLSLPDPVRDSVDRRLARMVEEPTADALYDSASDQWSVIVDDGLLLFAVVADPAALVVLRLVVL